MVKETIRSNYDFPLKIKASIVVSAVGILVAGFFLGKWYPSHQPTPSQIATSKIVSGAKDTNIVSGTVSKVTASNLEMVDLQDETRKFAVDEKTTITRGGKKISTAEIKVNDRTRVIPDLSDTRKARQILIVVDQPSP